MDIMNVTLVVLVAIGMVNVLTFFLPNLDSKVKFAASFFAALLVSFIPIEIANILLNHLRMAIEAAFAASGVYKLSQNIGEERK